jgi:hypothetical protein
MNEQIREFAEKCEGRTICECGETGFNYEKFAELIVRECAGIYDKIDNGNLHMGTDDYLEALQKHFGVEQ